MSSKNTSFPIVTKIVVQPEMTKDVPESSAGEKTKKEESIVGAALKMKNSS